MEYSREAYRLSKGISYIKGEKYAQLNTSVCNFLLSAEDNILENLIDSLKYFETIDDKAGRVKAMLFTGNVYDSYGDYENGIQYCQNSLKLAEEIGYKEGQGDALSVLGLIYSRLSDYKSAVIFYEKSLKIRQELNDLPAVSSCYNLIARANTLNKNYPAALEFYDKSKQLREKINDYKALPWTYIGIASTYEKTEDYAKSVEYYSKGLELNKKTADKRCDLHCFLGLGRVYTKLINKDKSFENLLNALKTAKSLNAKSLLYETHLAFAEYYEMTGITYKAMEHYKHHQKIKEEVLNENIQNKLKHQQITFEIEHTRKIAEIFLLKKFELKEAYGKIKDVHKQVVDSIRYAKRIQEAILPSESMLKELLPESFILYKPKDVVSGDFYFIEKIDDNIIFAAADCTGHGVPGAFMSVLGFRYLEQAIKENRLTKPSEILQFLDEGICKSLRYNLNDGIDIAIITLDKRTDILQYSGAYNPVYLIRACAMQKNELIEIKADRFSIGKNVVEVPKTFTNNEFQLQKGDIIYMFSDGYKDQFGGHENKKFKISQFKELLLANCRKPMLKQCEIYDKTFEEWKGSNDQTDDVLVTGVKII
ncbi:MAG: tetratricopeptide repeat protein [Bacteroidia bacterium]|nr:tetratricopeptide repeat protein [Bacteroidia bacterium]